MTDETTQCVATTVEGRRCNSTMGLSADGLCQAHQPGARERLQASGRLGGAAFAAKMAGQGFTLGELTPMATVDDAKRELDEVRKAILTRRVTHAEGNAATKAIEGWLKAEAAGVTTRLVNELRAELDSKARQIADLQRQLAAVTRAARSGP